MVNYYEILGIPASSGFTEIKAAFRRLAKIYHPDKNPTGQEEFKKILKAYETLSDPSSKTAYDLKLKYHRNAAAKKTNSSPGTKNWSFDEKELKRRQYYQEHYKKKQDSNAQTQAQAAQIKKNYNEYKYILYATPIAVALFLLIVNFATKKPVLEEKNPSATEKRTLSMNESPYLDYFGSPTYVNPGGKNLVIKNFTGSEIIVCLFYEKHFLRSCYIKEGMFVEIPQLPQKPIEVRYSSGKDFSFEIFLEKGQVYGAFSKDRRYYKCPPDNNIGGANELTLQPGPNLGFKEISEADFFKKD